MSVAFSPDGSLLASASADGLVQLWNPDTETLEVTLEVHIDRVLSVAFSPDGSLLASASADGLVGLWDPHTPQLKATLGHESPVLSVAFSPDGDLLAIAEVRTGQHVCGTPIHRNLKPLSDMSPLF